MRQGFHYSSNWWVKGGGRRGRKRAWPISGMQQMHKTMDRVFLLSMRECENLEGPVSGNIVSSKTLENSGDKKATQSTHIRTDDTSLLQVCFPGTWYMRPKPTTAYIWAHPYVLRSSTQALCINVTTSGCMQSLFVIGCLYSIDHITL